MSFPTPVIYPCLWFDGNAKEAATFYCSAFRNSKITDENPMVVAFESEGQRFICLNGGAQFKFNPAVSFFVVCETLEETDQLWNKLSDGGSVLMPLEKYEWSEKYGWLEDRFGVNWHLNYGKMEDVGQKFTPTLLFTGPQHGNAEKAIEFYMSVFDGSSLTGIARYDNEENEVDGTVKHAQFSLGGNVFMGMDSAQDHKFNFNESISFVVECNSQEEIDYYWDKLTQGGNESMCGWLKDRYGVSWQIVPAVLPKLLADPSRAGRVAEAFMKMKKFDIEKLMNA